MKNSPLAHINFCCRLGIGLLFIYHGLVPKIFWLSPLEIELVELSRSPLPAQLLSPIAGGFEILLGLSIIFIRHSLYPIYIVASSLVVLLLYSAYVKPDLLAEAFNPVSTNGLGLLLCYLVIYSTKEGKEGG